MKQKAVGGVVVALVALGLTVSPSQATATSSRQAQSTFGPTQRAAAIDAARSNANAMAITLRLGSGEKLVVKDVIRDANGAQHIRYNRTYRGLRVLGGDLVVHLKPGGAVRSTDYATTRSIDLTSVQPSVSRSSARAAADRANANAAKPRLVVYAYSGKPRLAWMTKVTGTTRHGGPISDLVISNAKSGKQIASWSTIETADGTGNTLYSGTVSLQTTLSGSTYQLNDATRGGHKTYNLNGGTSGTGTLFTDADNVWGNGSTSSNQSAAADAHYGAAMTWDFYKNVLGRTGIRGDGVAAYSRVHYGTNYQNAFWNDACFCMTYGDGGSTFSPLVSLDVAGHEMSHGVTSNTAGLIYSGESGGLNESTSDIFGTMVEFYANNASDPGDYYIGEKIARDGTYLRRMDNPSLDGGSANCWYSGVGNLDVHYSSGVGNHFYYLLAEGSGAKTIGGRAHNSPTCNSSTVTGIGRVAAERIWYRALSVYMVSTTNYKGARDASIRAATDLYGGTSTQCTTVVAAWNAVSVPAGTASCGGQPPPPGNLLLNPGFESGAASWSATAGVITNSTANSPHSGAYYAWLDGYGRTHTDTLSQTVAIPAGKSSASLSLYLRITTRETTTTIAYDTLKVQVIAGGTTTTLATYSNLNKNTAYALKTFSLNSYIGQTVTVKFLGVEDSSLATSFLVDDTALSTT